MKVPSAQLLFSQGFGTRRECETLLRVGALSVNGSVIRAKETEIETDGLTFFVNNTPWNYSEKAYLAMNKPEGYECSAKPSHWPSIYALLPEPLRNRPVKGGQNGVQSVGRLDHDTTGLLLLSDDGQFIHAMNSPKHHVPKVYHVTLADPLSAPKVQNLLDGVRLDDEAALVRAAACVQTGSHAIALTLTEGKYHQVKRMIGAIGNRVVGLHRHQIGGFVLPETLAPGQWQWLTDAELALLR